jgi:hypothetical protein
MYLLFEEKIEIFNWLAEFKIYLLQKNHMQKT